MGCGVGLRLNLDPVSLWLWHKLAAVAPIRTLAGEPPYAMGAALKRPERNRERESGPERKRERKWKEGKKEGRKEGRKEGSKERSSLCSSAVNKPD